MKKILIYTIKFYFGNARVLVLVNKNKIVVPLFGAAYAAPNKGTTILY